MRIDQSYFTLGSSVGTSCRPAKTRIFRSPARSKAATGRATTSAASATVTSKLTRPRPVDMAVLRPRRRPLAPRWRQDTIRYLMASLRPVAAAEIESLAIGAWILGTGGGGSPYLALLNMRKLYRQGAVCRLMDPMELGDDDLVAVVSTMGAPLVGQERLTDPRTVTRAVTMMEEYLATGATGAGWESTPWRATQRAAWEALRKASQEASAQSALRAALQEGRANGNP